MGRHEDDVAGLGEEVEAKRGLHGGAVNALGPGPIELAHGHEATDARAGEAAFKTAAGSLLLLALDEMLEELRGTPPAFRGEGDDIIQVRSAVAQAERGELISERGIGRVLLRRGGPRRRRSSAPVGH